MSATVPADVRGISEAQLRRWLGLLHRPDRLARPELVELLRAHGRLPANASAVATGRAAADLLVDVIERLRPPDGAGRDQQLPYLVLRTCFVDGAKLFQAAGRIGISERQLSRERSRAIGLLKAELESPAAQADRPYRPEPIPAILEFLERPGLSRTLRETLEAHGLVNVHGPPGSGKTALVAELAAETATRTSVLWYRFRSGVNDSPAALLFELGEYLHSRGRTKLSSYLAESLPKLDATVATRLALVELDGASHLIVLDDFHLVEGDQTIAGLIDEVAARLPELRAIAISRHRDAGPRRSGSFAVPPFTRAETRALLTQLHVDASIQMAETIHEWTGGIPHLIKLAASWLKTASPEEVGDVTASLNGLAEVQAFLLESITELIDPDDRAILEAASVFRDRFADDALAYVASRSRGEVQDASIRLVRLYIATRSRDGDCSFFHTSVRDYVYDRLDPERRATLHRRAAQWYERQGNGGEVAYHRSLSEQSEDEGEGRRAATRASARSPLRGTRP